MVNKDALIRDASKELERAEAAVKRARERLDRIQSLPEEPPSGSVIRFALAFNAYGSSYQYVAIRIGEYWYVTGQDHHKVSYNWVELVTFIRSAKELRMPPYVLSTDLDRLIIGF